MNSFRDPDGFVLKAADGRIFRCVYLHAADDLRAFLSLPLAAGLMAEGALAGAETLRKEELPADLRARFPRGSVVIEHEPILFPNFPYEWAPEMLHAAAALTLQLARAAVVFIGPRTAALNNKVRHDSVERKAVILPSVSKLREHGNRNGRLVG